MKKYIFLFFSLVMMGVSFGQQRGIKLTKTTSHKERFIKENKRIKIKTMDGQVLSGKFHIEENSIVINGEKTPFETIAFVKRNPLLQSILTNGFLIYGGALAVGFGAIIGVLADSAGYYLMIPGAAMIYAGLKSPNLNKKFERGKKWQLELIAN